MILSIHFIYVIHYALIVVGGRVPSVQTATKSKNSIVPILK